VGQTRPRDLAQPSARLSTLRPRRRAQWAAAEKPQGRAKGLVIEQRALVFGGGRAPVGASAQRKRNNPSPALIG